MGLAIKKPISFWNQKIKVDFKSLFRALTKTAAHGFTQKWAEVGGDFGEVITSLGLDRKPEEFAWLLIIRSVGRAVHDLAKECFNSRGAVVPDTIDEIVSRIDLSFENAEIVLSPDFFNRPQQCPLPGLVEKPFAKWLELCGLPSGEAKSVAHRLPSYFVLALNEEWQSRAEAYETVRQAIIGGPFTEQVRQELAWRRYDALLARQVQERVFGAVFSLDQVYVPLRGWYKEEREGAAESLDLMPFGTKKVVRVVVETHAALHSWLGSDDQHDCIRLISGGPGSGKSTLAKMFAWEQSKSGFEHSKQVRRILFVPLHRFSVTTNLHMALTNFAKYDALLPIDPFDPQNGSAHLLLIFDALDELASQGVAGQQAARNFVEQLQKTMTLWNSGGGRSIKVLITARSIVVSDIEARFRRPGQIIHLIPYVETKAEDYEDPKQLLMIDQRVVWWQQYGRITGDPHDAFPNQLRYEELDEITAQPLLNYLAAIALAKGLNMTPKMNLNSVYEHLVKRVFDRPWEPEQHPTLTYFSNDKDFFVVIQEIAIAIWHGNGRTATKAEIISRCQSETLKCLFEKLEIAAADGVTRLLMAFYFRRAGDVGQNEAAFEFSHKSFGEYLASRRIVAQIRITAEELKRDKGGKGGWNEQESLKRWIALCGPKPMDGDLFRFIKREVALELGKAGRAILCGWQSALDGLLTWVLRRGMPIQCVEHRFATFREQVLWARNSEEALLACGYAVAEVTQTLRSIEWPEPTALGLLLNRLRGQRSGPWNVLAMDCLGYLKADLQYLHVADLWRANLVKSNLSGANLTGANLVGANLAGSDFARANLVAVHLRDANLKSAKLENAKLVGATLRHASLIGADLKHANLERANLVGANLTGADLRNANLERANLERANLQDADLRYANLNRTVGVGSTMEEAPSGHTDAESVEPAKRAGGMWLMPQHRELVLRLGIIGCGDSGKTCLLNAIRRTVMDVHPGKQLHMGMARAASARMDLLSAVKGRYAEEALWRQGGLGITPTPNDLEYAIFEGAKPVVTFVHHDAVGQLLNFWRLGDEDLNSHVEFISRTSTADILWAVIAVQKEYEQKECYIDRDELHLVMGYTKEAIHHMSESRKVSVGIILTMADRAGTLGPAHMRATLDGLAAEVARRFTPFFENESKVWSSCVLPVSAFGLDKAEELETSSKEAARETILNSQTLEPWNVDKLLLWSLVSGLSQPRSRAEHDEAMRIWSLLKPSLDRTSGPAINIKMHNENF